MIRRHPSTKPVASIPVGNACPRPESHWAAAPDSNVEAEWERSLFMQPARLAEARRQETAGSRRWGGLLLAGLAALAVGVGARDVRAESSSTGTTEESSTTFDYWAWLASWFDEATGEESSTQQKNDEGTTDPTEGN